MRSKTHIATLLAGLTFALTACSDSKPQTEAEPQVVATSDVASAQAIEVKTYARFVPERSDDFAFENDLVAFRMYGPALREGKEDSGVDCWLKRVNYSIIDKWYKQHLEQDKSYHTDWGEGLDNYHVGSSAGCGSSALWLNDQRQPLETFVDYEILSQTTEKTEFALTFEKEIQGVVYAERKVVSIELGKRLFKATSTFTKNGEIAADLPVVVAVSTHDEKGEAEVNAELGYIAVWENLDGSGLGTGVKVDPTRIKQGLVVNSDGVADKGHGLFVLHTDENGQIIYHAGYGWEKAGDITTAENWQAYLAAFQL
ncbi:DUF4861 family protein [Glaciecola sp. 1036]|uniref:DUF4861 family protein n=1 Tax=Alteromonadaceae TaxID=72275 RepID=UPI003D062DCC